MTIKLEEEEHESHEAEDEHDASARKRAKVNVFYNYFFQMVTAPAFNCMIFVLILLNTVVLAMDDYYMTDAKR